MYRREILKLGAALSATAALPRISFANSAFAPEPGAWRTFEITTRIELSGTEGGARAWIPLPALAGNGWNRPGTSAWTSNATEARIVSSDAVQGDMLLVVWNAGVSAPAVEIVSHAATRDRAIDLTKPTAAAPLTPAERARYLTGTPLVPTDGIVKETSDRIVGSVTDDVEKARLIYDWVVANTYRRAATRGCGTGDVVAMLKSGDLGGKCADINPLFVGLARAAGLPARDLYGLRVAPSKFGYKSLGAKNEIVTKAQHCRAEVYLSGFGWVPVDPADVRKVMLEEAERGLAAGDRKVVAARETLFGAWEGNWIAYNDLRDVALPGASGPDIGFLMYPQAEVASARLDCLEPDAFKYSIRSREIFV
ncbi:transglutaminase domain-containing protein [Sinorhizobium mexicanum]|uniref:Transglutaminase domain-containing protein n=1 Tax=Sinorhizobium mexicanum TaxID=375549 RepID=A0A859R5Q1_9HYPH|nr:transglutaminase domain-containing protein [Sinorhizobium mexicanum]QLL66191.1 transglutaminase domain-containing protein [Sinorhizobium mexicanum]